MTIDVYVAMTGKAVRDYRGSATALAQLAVDTANRAYKQNDLPIRLNVADHRTVSGYADAGSIEGDLANLTDAGNSAFSRVRAEVEQANADVVVMFVGDYRLSNDDNNDYLNTCGEAHGLLADDKDSAFAVVESVCVPAHSFTNVIGYMQGAGYNAEQEANGEFDYGHGHYHAGADRRTVMSQSAGNCDDPRTSSIKETCARQGIWSDPHRNFFGTTTPAGTAESWNARVVFSTAPHIASLRGDAQSYDSSRPTGNITLPSIIPSTGTIQINASFSEPIHDWFPPHITITDGATTTVAAMERSSDTTYTYQHRLDGESGKVHLLFSNERDLFGNPIVKTPTSGASFDVNARDVTQARPPAGSILGVSAGFSTLGIWTATGDNNGATWQARTPVEGVPDQRISTNKVASSSNCDDSCFLTLRYALDTTRPLVISFDRYVDAKADRGEGLHVEYSVNGGAAWSRLVSHTHDNGGDTDRWEKTVVGLSIPQSSAMLRLHAESDRDDEIVEVDNLRIFRPDAVPPDVTFKASLNSALSTITITMSKSSSHTFSASDFALSRGAVSSVHNPANSAARSLQVSGIPYDTAVTVTYAGADLDLGGGAVLNNGTAATAPPVPRVSPPTSDTVPPVITPPADISVNATGVLTALPGLGEASATDNAAGSPAVTNDAPPYLPIGNTTVTWNATDSSGNWATATQLVTVSEGDLDSDWHYALRWHAGYWGHAAIAPTKHLGNLSISPSDVGYGTMHLFKTLRTDDIRNRNVTIISDESSLHNVTVYVLDGAYSNRAPSDFTLAGGPALKGGGMLASYALSDMPESFGPDWARSQLDETTLVVSLEKKVSRYSPFQIHSVEFDGHSKWIFGDYKVEQRGNKGTYLLLPTRPSVHALPVNDTFAGSLDGWTYWGYTSDYVLRQDSSAGRPSPSAFISMDRFNVFSGMSKIVDISSMQDGQNLTLSYDYRASSLWSYGTVTNSYLRVLDADTGEHLLFAAPAYGGVRDTGWRSYSTDLTDETSGFDRIEIVLGFHDSWIASWNQSNWYDNVRVYAASLSDAPPGAASGQAAGASAGRAPAAANMTGGAADPNGWFTRLP